MREERVVEFDEHIGVLIFKPTPRQVRNSGYEHERWYYFMFYDNDVDIDEGGPFLTRDLAFEEARSVVRFFSELDRRVAEEKVSVERGRAYLTKDIAREIAEADRLFGSPMSLVMMC